MPESGTDHAAHSRSRVSVTCSVDGRTHQIEDVMLGAELSGGSGRITALCGRSITAAAMSDEPGPPCPLCTAALGLAVPRARHRRVRWR